MRDRERQMVVINHQMHLERSWTTASQDMLSYLATSKPFSCGLESRLLPQIEGAAQPHEHLFSLTTKGGMAWRSYEGAPWEYLYVLQVDRNKVLPTRRPKERKERTPRPWPGRDGALGVGCVGSGVGSLAMTS